MTDRHPDESWEAIDVQHAHDPVQLMFYSQKVQKWRERKRSRLRTQQAQLQTGDESWLRSASFEADQSGQGEQHLRRPLVAQQRLESPKESVRVDACHFFELRLGRTGGLACSLVHCPYQRRSRINGRVHSFKSIDDELARLRFVEQGRGVAS